MENLLVITGSKILASGFDEPSDATIEIDKVTGKILRIHPIRSSIDSYSSFLVGDDKKKDFIDAGNDVVMPGLIDTHVHLNEPGRTDWEGFETGTKAAAAGGVTTVIDMPLNSIPPTTTVDNLNQKINVTKNKSWVDIGFYGGVIPGNQNDLIPLIKSGVKGFKCFLIESGVDEFPCVNEQDVRMAFETLKVREFLESRPSSLEIDAISFVIELTKEYNKSVRTHIVHLSASDALDAITKAKLVDGLPITVETCFHYLCLSAEEIPAGRTEFKCCPPIRDDKNRDKLWKALVDGVIDCIVSDHSPCTSNLKEGGFGKAWGGISTLQFGLPVLWTEAKKRNLSSFNNLVNWLSRNPAKLVGLNDRKGEIKITEDSIEFKNKVTPYLGKEFYGVVKKTILRGKIIYDDNEITDIPLGELLL
nr:12072_t:CDS:2 [Entrophospora candida]